MSSIDFPMIMGGITGLFWAALAVFKLIISLSAQKSFPGKAASLMVMGSIGGLVFVVLNPFLSVFIARLDFPMESIPVVFSIIGVVRGIFSLLFLLGLYQLIKERLRAENPTSRHLL